MSCRCGMEWAPTPQWGHVWESILSPGHGGSRGSNSVCQAWLLSHLPGPIFISFLLKYGILHVFMCPLAPGLCRSFLYHFHFSQSTTEASPYLNISFHLGRILLQSSGGPWTGQLCFTFQKLESWARATTLGFYRLSTKPLFYWQECFCWSSLNTVWKRKRRVNSL